MGVLATALGCGARGEDPGSNNTNGAAPAVGRPSSDASAPTNTMGGGGRGGSAGASAPGGSGGAGGPSTGPADASAPADAGRAASDAAGLPQPPAPPPSPPPVDPPPVRPPPACGVSISPVSPQRFTDIPAGAGYRLRLAARTTGGSW